MKGFLKNFPVRQKNKSPVLNEGRIEGGKGILAIRSRSGQIGLEDWGICF